MRKIAWRVCWLLALASAAIAQQVPDFSGTYVLRSTGKIVLDKLVKKVVQDQDTIKITWKDRTGEITREYRLDGSKIQGEERDGTPTVEWIEIKGRQLIIRSSVKARSGALKDVPITKTQKWRLSKDLKTVMISEQFQLPEGMHVEAANYLSTVVIYTRH